jgi:hypothetical protein
VSDVFVPAERRRNVFISPFLSQRDQASEIETVTRLMGDEPDAPGVRIWRKIPGATVDSSNPLQNWHIDDVDSSNPEPDI